jgi:hypothetical protein
VSDLSFVVKNYLAVNSNAFIANGSGAYTTGIVNATSVQVGSAGIVNSSGVYTTGVVNSTSYSIGTSFTANSTLVNAYSISTQTNTFTIGTSAYYVANGNLGLGTATPAYTLDVAGAARVVNNVWYSTSGYNPWRTSNYNGNFYINYNNTTDFIVVSSSNGTNILTNLSITGTTNAAAVKVSSLSVGTANLTSVISGGFGVNAYSIGTLSSGSYTFNPVYGNYQYYTNNGAHTIVAPSTDCAIDVLILNGSSAGSITFSGFTLSATSFGDSYYTTAGQYYIISIRRINGIATYVNKALQ